MKIYLKEELNPKIIGLFLPNYFMGKELLYKMRTSKKQCDITAIKLKSWHKDYVKYIPKNLRFVSDEIINLMNQQLDSK